VSGAGGDAETGSEVSSSGAPSIAEGVVAEVMSQSTCTLELERSSMQGVRSMVSMSISASYFVIAG